MAYADQVKKIAEASALYEPFHNEFVRIDFTEDDSFTGTGEESGQPYKIYFDDVDLGVDRFYRLELVNHNEF